MKIEGITTQITKIWLSDRCGGKNIPMTLKIEYCRSRFEGYLGNVRHYVRHPKVRGMFAS